MSFIAAYACLFIDPVRAAALGWVVAMVTRQSGHFFFEPKGYDTINEATHEYKEAIKVGYNLRRKVILFVVWGLTPVVIYFSPTLFGMLARPESWDGYIYNLAILWIALGGAAIAFRMVHLFFIYNVRAGVVWTSKILTDPFHDMMLYHRAPLLLLKGHLSAPSPHHS